MTISPSRSTTDLVNLKGLYLEDILFMEQAGGGLSG